MATPRPFSLSHPYAGITHVRFSAQPGILGQVDMAYHFLRFQEHYESPGFKGRVFTWSQYVAWYKQARGSFSYAQDWSGFNFPGHILKPFRQGAFNPLTKREQSLLQALADVKDEHYVIGTNEADDAEGSLDHELAHAFWHMDPEYRAAVEAILEGGDYSKQEAALAEGQGYDPMVFRDEIQACAVSGDGEFGPGSARAANIRGIFEKRLNKTD